MRKKLLLSLALMFSALTIQAMANTTIYTDEIGRLHFLGKDPGSRTMQEIQNFNNPEQKDLTNIIYKNEQENPETKVNTTTPAENAEVAPAVDNASVKENPEQPVKKGKENKTKGSFTFNKGAMDASDPYSFGETNLAPAETTKPAKKDSGKVFKSLERDY